MKSQNKLSFESEFYQNQIFLSKSFSDEKLKTNKTYNAALIQVKI